jgi:hypothetical protein
MAHFVGLDVSVKETSVCIVDDAGKVILEQKVPTEPEDIIAVLSSLAETFGRIGVEADSGPSRRPWSGEVRPPCGLFAPCRAFASVGPV